MLGVEHIGAESTENVCSEGRVYRVFGDTNCHSRQSEQDILRKNVAVYIDTYGVDIPDTLPLSVNQIDNIFPFQRINEHVDRRGLTAHVSEWGESPSPQEVKRSDAVRVYTACAQLSLYCPISIGYSYTHAWTKFKTDFSFC